MHSHPDIETLVKHHIAQFLELQPDHVHLHTTLYDLGADSFDMVELQAILEEHLRVQIDEPLPCSITVAMLVDACRAVAP